MKWNTKILIVWISLILFVSGFFILLNGDIQLKSVQFDNFDISGNVVTTNDECPNVLIKNGNDILLYNNNDKNKGIDPIKFKDLDQYSDYLEEQHKKGNNCPVLFLQKETDIQNKDVYRIRQSPFYIEGGLPALPIQFHDNSKPLKIVDASRESGYNTNMYPGFDPYGFDNGRFTELDVIHDSTSKNPSGSVNPADPNWLGVISTQNAVDKGAFKDNEVRKVMYPKVTPLQIV